MRVLEGTEHLLGRAIESVTSRVVYLFGGGRAGFDASSFPRSVLKQVQGRVQTVGQRTLCPHRIQLFVPSGIDRGLGGLSVPLRQEVEAAVTRWAEREGHELLGPVGVEWIVDELTEDDQVVVNISFGGGGASSAELEPMPAGSPSVLELVPPDASETEEETTVAAPWARLVARDGLMIELVGEPVVGRQAPADVLAPDPTVSTRHALFVRDDEGRCFVRDLGSANGTWVNGQRVTDRARVHSGDAVELGDQRFTFAEVGA